MVENVKQCVRELLVSRRENVASARSKQLSECLTVRVGDGTRTQQHLRDEVDINTIMRRFGMTGQLPLMDTGGLYGDFTDIHDYASAVAVVRRADERFMELPAEVRERFANSPASFIEFARSASREAFDDALRVAASTPPPVVATPAVERPPES